MDLAVDDQVTKENFDTFATLYTLVHQIPDEDETDDELPAITVLPSMLLMMSHELPEHQDDIAVRFIVIIPDDDAELLVTAYDANAHQVPYRHYLLAADYAGEGIYWVEKVK